MSVMILMMLQDWQVSCVVVPGAPSRQLSRQRQAFGGSQTPDTLHRRLLNSLECCCTVLIECAAPACHACWLALLATPLSYVPVPVTMSSVVGANIHKCTVDVGPHPQVHCGCRYTSAAWATPGHRHACSAAMQHLPAWIQSSAIATPGTFGAAFSQLGQFFRRMKQLQQQQQVAAG